MKDYLIVGQGLAGITIANELMANGKSFLAVANKNLTSATSVAAGMYNPLIFRRITQSWMVDDVLPVMFETFKKLEQTIHQPLIHRKAIIKLVNEDEYQRWQIKQNDPLISKYIQELQKGTKINGIHEYYGTATVAHSGYIDLNALSQGFHQLLQQENSLIYESFDFNDLEIFDTHISWKGTHFKNIIFCEGAFAINNPLFPEVKYKLTKGDVLTLSIDNFKLEYIINKMSFILEKSEGEFLCGSTYNWSDIDFNTYPKDLDYLKERLSYILNKPFELIQHKTAIRPTVNDRRPVLGSHAKYKNVHYFNGLGTKGVMLAPYFSKQMVNYLIEGKPFHPEVDINRFRKQP
ncbi:NAD(P)/FAD-dependent oxidoreductase [Labilibacter marinus]|uniref:NAD(P)/FAD-dependent oxidoreductase n=1 Tax=Labilibacter marinus TaxID=1477105 RepID=UPI00082FA695|nr:FAD-dependent oxidoreductase [Labilibacter marinus]